MVPEARKTGKKRRKSNKVNIHSIGIRHQVFERFLNGIVLEYRCMEHSGDRNVEFIMPGQLVCYTQRSHALGQFGHGLANLFHRLALGQPGAELIVTAIHAGGRCYQITDTCHPHKSLTGSTQ